MKIESAHGRTACLIYCGSGQYKIRVWHPNKLGTFADYDIRHSDLFFEIQDEDAYLYEQDDKLWLDHSPQTLGIDNETSMEK